MIKPLKYLLIAGLILGVAGSSSGRQPQQTNGQLGVLIVGLDPGTDTSRAIQVFDAAKSINVSWIRIGVIWAIANPQPGQYDWQWYDWLYKAAYERGFKIISGILFTPQWASACPDSAAYYYFPPSDSVIADGKNGYDYLEDFASALAGRYKDYVSYWECWNEPDMYAGLKNPGQGTTTSRYYAKMLAYFCRGVKRANPAAQVLIGGLAQPGNPDFADTAYLQNLLADSLYPAGQNFDIMNIHTNFKSPAQIALQMQQNREILQAFGLDKPLWITETSYTSDETYQNLTGYRDGDASLAQYVRDAMTVELENNADVVLWAALNDYGADVPESDPYKHSGLFTYDLRKKSAAQAFEDLTLQ